MARSVSRGLPLAVGAALVGVLAAALVVEAVRGRGRPGGSVDGGASWLDDGAGEGIDEGCVHCHEPVAVSPSHAAELGCAACHLGDPLWRDEARAHRGMVARPSELAVVERTCGQADCHPDQVERVRGSLMASNAGITAVLAFQFGEADDPDGGGAGALADGLQAIAATEPVAGGSLAEDHARKFCATCHLHKALGDLPGEIGTRGGGCADCHLAAPDDTSGWPTRGLAAAGTPGAAAPALGEPGWAGDGGPATHPRLTTRIHSDECVKCHNRSARIGLSYRGQFEDEGHATPFAQGGPTLHALSGGRSYSELLPDVHHEAGMHCVDCHLGSGVMGDGERYAHMEQQLATACEDCHTPRWSGPVADEPEPDSAAWVARRAASVNPRVELPPGTRLAVGVKGDWLPHVQRLDDGGAVLIGRVDGERRSLPGLADAPYHTMPGHERLSCQACHSAWTPQCYGCHEVYFRDELQLDKLAWRETPGRWEERRSYLRFERPTLGLGPAVPADGEPTVQPFAPGCQVFLTEVGGGPDDGAAEVVAERFPALAMAAFDPHTTRTEVPPCVACHLDPKVLGLGDGTLTTLDGAPAVASAWDPARSGLAIAHPLDAFVAGDGAALQTTSRREARPFDGDELRAILAVGACLPCHDRWDDPLWTDWDAAVQRWRTEPSLPCVGAGGET